MLILWFSGEFQCFGPRIEANVMCLGCLSGCARSHVLHAWFGVDLIVFWGFNRKWFEYWISGVFVSCMPRNAILSIWLHSLLNSGDSGIWHASFRVLFEYFGF